MSILMKKKSDHTELKTDAEVFAFKIYFHQINRTDEIYEGQIVQNTLRISFSIID